MACMWRKCHPKQIISFRKHLLNILEPVRVRTFLSPAYTCDKSWRSRLNSPALRALDPNDFSLKLYEKFEKEGKLHAIDIDILANRMSNIDEEHMEFAENLFFRFRHTNEYLQVPESTSHAFIRSYLENGRIDRLLHILKEKLDYGIFLDNFSANLMLDHFIKKHQYHYGAQVAYDLMLQEDFSHPLVRYLSWYACYLHLMNPPPPTEVATAEETPAEEQEEQWILVSFIDNMWWDDHFDLQKEDHLLGKTLAMIGRMEDSVQGRSSQLIGLAKYEKFEDALELLKGALGDKSVTFTKEAVDMFASSLDSAEAEEPAEEKAKGSQTLDDVRPRVLADVLQSCQHEFQSIHHQLQKNGNIVDADIKAYLRDTITEIASKMEKVDMEEQNKLFSQWNETRQNLLDAQVNEYRERQKKEEIERKLKELQDKEEQLSFFDQFDALSIGEKKALHNIAKVKHRKRPDEMIAD